MFSIRHWLPSTVATTGVNDIDARHLPRHTLVRGACDSGAHDTGGNVTAPGTIAGAIQFPSLPGRLGFAASTSTSFARGYLTFQDGPNRLLVNTADVDAVFCPVQCLGTPTSVIPAPSVATLTLSGDVSRSWGNFHMGG